MQCLHLCSHVVTVPPLWMHAWLCGLQKDLLSLQMPLTIKSWKCLEASVDINANRSKKNSGKVPLISTLALILWVDVCGQMLLFLQSLSAARAHSGL